MEGCCGALTLSGAPCKIKIRSNETVCRMHRGPQCSLCLGTISSFSKTLPCNHVFHERCIDRWKRTCPSDPPTCPLCREPFDVPLYRCILVIERVADSNIQARPFQLSNINAIVEGFGLDLRDLLRSRNQQRLYAELHFDIEQGENLEEVLEQFNIPRE